MRLRLARGLEPKTQCGHLVDFEWRVRIVQQCVTGILDVFPDFFRCLMDRGEKNGGERPCQPEWLWGGNRKSIALVDGKPVGFRSI